MMPVLQQQYHRQGRILVTTDGIHSKSAFAEPGLAERVEFIDMYALAEHRLEDHRALLLNASCDQKVLQRLGARLQAYLEGGGVIVFCGHIVHPFLPVLQPFVPMVNYRLIDLRVALDPTHPIFRGVANDDVTFRRGVAGFFGRGANPAPPGARVTATLGPSRVPVDWQACIGDGTLYVHTGNDLWSFDGDGTASRIPAQLLDWIDVEVDAKAGRDYA